MDVDTGQFRAICTAVDELTARVEYLEGLEQERDMVSDIMTRALFTPYLPQAARPRPRHLRVVDGGTP
ncbi:MAG: hypothetical protein ACRDPY_09660 [Streptosporangiaceae bacterium]